MHGRAQGDGRGIGSAWSAVGGATAGLQGFVKQGFIRVLTDNHPSKSKVSTVIQHLQLFLGNHVEQHGDGSARRCRENSPQGSKVQGAR